MSFCGKVSGITAEYSIPLSNAEQTLIDGTSKLLGMSADEFVDEIMDQLAADQNTAYTLIPRYKVLLSLIDRSGKKAVPRIREVLDDTTDLLLRNPERNLLQPLLGSAEDKKAWSAHVSANHNGK